MKYYPIVTFKSIAKLEICIRSVFQIVFLFVKQQLNIPIKVNVISEFYLNTSLLVAT